MFCFITYLLVSCNGIAYTQDFEKNLVGNWYLYKNTGAEEINYQEVYFDGEVLYIFTPDNYSVSFRKNYAVNKSNFYYLNDTKTDTILKMRLKVYQNVLTLENEKGKIKYKRVHDNGLLSDYLEEKITKEAYEEKFEKRMALSGIAPR